MSQRLFRVRDAVGIHMDHLSGETFFSLQTHLIWFTLIWKDSSLHQCGLSQDYSSMLVKGFHHFQSTHDD